MVIQQTFIIKCDGCGEDLGMVVELPRGVVSLTKESVIKLAERNLWRINGKAGQELWYCPNCTKGMK